MLIPSGNTVINTPGNPASSHVPQLVKADTRSESLPWALGELQKVLVELSDLTSTKTSVLEKMSVWQKWQELPLYIFPIRTFSLMVFIDF